MKIVHVYSDNLDVFVDAVKGTDYTINGSRNDGMMVSSFFDYNVRDVVGLVVFKPVMTRRTLNVIKAFDDFFIYNRLPVIVVSDQAVELCKSGKLGVNNSHLFVLNSQEGTISDLDIKRIFVTLSCEAGDMYDLTMFDKRSKGFSSAIVEDKQEDEFTAASVLQEMKDLLV